MKKSPRNRPMYIPWLGSRQTKVAVRNGCCRGGYLMAWNRIPWLNLVDPVTNAELFNFCYCKLGWPRSAVCFSIRCFIIGLNTTYKSSTLVCCLTVKPAAAVQIRRHQVDVEYTKIKIKGQLPLFKVLWIITTLFQWPNNKVKTNTNNATDFLRYDIWNRKINWIKKQGKI